MPHHDHVIIPRYFGDRSHCSGKQALLLEAFFFRLDVDAIVLHHDSLEDRVRMRTKTVSDQPFAHRPGEPSLVGRKLVIERFGLWRCTQA